MRKRHLDSVIPVTARPPYFLRRVIPRAACAIAQTVLFAALTLPVGAQEKPADLTDKSLEDLMNIQVTSVSKKEQKLSRTAAAVFVITQEDIKDSGATNVPDLLRMVPGLDVAQRESRNESSSRRG